MLLMAGRNAFDWVYTNQATPSTTGGLSVTAGAGVEGSWGTLITSANLAQDCYGILLRLFAGNASAGQRDYLVDIGVDPAGGTAFSPVISNILAHQASNAVDGGRWFYFPYFIKAGQSVGMRAQGNGANAIRGIVTVFGRPTHPEAIAVGQYSETIGASGNGGTAITPGNTAAEGTWTSIGTTTRPLWWWQICAGFSGTTTTSQMYFVDLAYGDASNKVLIIENMPLFHPGTAERTGNPLWPNCVREVPAGSTLYIRASSSGTSDAGFNALAVGIGG